KAATLGEHPMHIEFIAVRVEVIRELRDRLMTGRPVIAVGTTSARTLESLYWLGTKVIADPSVAPDDLVVHQWDAYAQDETAGTAEALQALLTWLEARELKELV